MAHRLRPWCVLVVVLFVGASALAQTAHPEARNASEMKFGPVPGLPTCATGAVQSGDPRSGPSIIYAKMQAGCSIPWHWHTPAETLMIVSGSATAEPKDGKPYKLTAGAFAMMPSHHAHRFSCPTACSLYVSSDGAFDIHYLSSAGKEVPAAEALKAVKEMVAQ